MENLLRELFIIALLSTVVIFTCHKVKIPPIVGFLLTGAAFGPSSLGLVRDVQTVSILSEIGVVFLLFSIGMELSIG
jgi:CPA2 family monovalent cation:H+ antiporter-2